MFSLQAALTTSTLFSTVSLTVSSDNSSQFCMLPGWSLASDAMSTSHWHCMTLFTGCRYHSAHLQNCTDDCRLFLRPMSKVLWWHVHSCTHVAAGFRLPSAEDGDLVIPRVQLTCFGWCSFCMCGPTIWNKLPQDLWSTDTRKQLKCSCKRWLFECVYSRRCVW